MNAVFHDPAAALVVDGPSHVWIRSSSFDEDTPERVLAQIRPDVWVEGGGYTASELPEASLVSSWGGRTVVVPDNPGRSTTRLATALATAG